MWWLIIGIVLLTLQFLALIIRLFRPALYKKVNRKGHVRDVPNKWGYLIIVVGIFTLANGIRREIGDRDKKASVEHANLNFCTAPNANFKYNPSTDTLLHPDSLRLRIWICNNGKVNAVNLIDTGYFFITFKDICVFADSSVNSSFSPATVIPANEGQMNFFRLNIHNPEVKTDRDFKFYFYYVLHYSDDANDSHKMETILKIDWSYIGKEMYEPNREEYARLKSCISLRTFR